jgi:low temperature requirement protein LtrA
MMERLGLLTIIVFGEAILGVIGGTGHLLIVNWNVWISFGLGILVVFSLWWIFFALIADRENEKGFIKGQLLLLLFIPTLASLGMTGASFPGVMDGLMPGEHADLIISRGLFGAGVAGFLWSITAISLFLEYPGEYDHARKIMQPLLLISGVVIILITRLMFHMEVLFFLLSVFLVLFFIIFVIMRGWYQVELKHMRESE